MNKSYRGGGSGIILVEGGAEKLVRVALVLDLSDPGFDVAVVPKQ